MTRVQAAAPSTSPHWIQLSDGSLEALKWLALILMTADHVNKYLFEGASTTVFAAGRIVLPLFALVLAFNLARPNALQRGTYGRVMLRLAIFGAVATGPFLALGELLAGWYPLNVLWMLFVAVLAIYQLDRRNHCPNHPWAWTCGAIATIAIGGSMVEYWWPGVCLVVFAWCYFKRPSVWSALCWLFALAVLSVVNGNHWAVAGVAVFVLGARFRQITLPRTGVFFYVYYPLHLAIIYSIKACI